MAPNRVVKARQTTDHRTSFIPDRDNVQRDGRRKPGLFLIELRHSMEQFISFNGVQILLTTGESLHKVQSIADEADVILSVYPGRVRILKGEVIPPGLVPTVPTVTGPGPTVGSGDPSGECADGLCGTPSNDGGGPGSGAGGLVDTGDGAVCYEPPTGLTPNESGQ